MAGPHLKELPPYLVSMPDAEPAPVDPSLLKAEGCFLTHVRGNRFVLHRGARTVALIIEATDRQHVQLTHGSQTVEVRVQDHRDQLLAAWGATEGNAGRESRIEAPMPGLVLKVLVAIGQPVTKGDSLLVLEAMKMENDIKAHFDGVVKTIKVGAGDAVSKGQLLIEFD
ncbi:MAG: biotin/lipoyl-binding protein [Bacteroidetes bacterium]|nr:biotin/lipoyl-binding protein [Bacteroidota bacterium]